jgi:hypothetical protein
MPDADDTTLRAELRTQWRSLLDRIGAAGTPSGTVLETMAEALTEELVRELGKALAERYLRFLAESIHDLEVDEIQELIEGDGAS